jgi:hypothetical protein
MTLPVTFGNGSWASRSEHVSANHGKAMTAFMAADWTLPAGAGSWSAGCVEFPNAERPGRISRVLSAASGAGFKTTVSVGSGLAGDGWVDRPHRPS